LYALAFSTLLSSQETGAHLRRTLIRFQGNHSTLPGRESLVNSFVRTCWLVILAPPPRVQSLEGLCARHKPLRSASWWLPGTVRLPATQSLGARRTLGNRGPFVKSNRTTPCYRRSASRSQCVVGPFSGSGATRSRPREDHEMISDSPAIPAKMTTTRRRLPRRSAFPGARSGNDRATGRQQTAPRSDL
jgi:hypothetical protein